jgi:predicted TIM-barrel fold metal-dependent hydrolase
MLASCPLPVCLQLYVKSSAFFRVSGEPYPYADAMAGVAALVEAYGSQRVMWGSDFPWVTEKCG